MKMKSPTKWKTKAGIGCAALLVLLLVLLIRGHTHSGKETSVPVAVTRPGYSNLAESISITGEMRPYQQVDLHSKVAGYLQDIKVDIGDHVKEGNVIAVLEVPELHEELQSAQAATAAAREGVKSAQAKYNEIHLSCQRLQEVAKKNPKLIAQQDLDNIASKDQSAAADLALSQQRVAECAANQKKMETMLNYSTIAAPFDGVITKRYADPGSLIQAGTSSNTQSMPVVSLAQDNLLRATFPLPESIVAKLQVGDEVKIQIPSLEKTLEGKISRFSRHVDKATRTMEAQIDVPNPNGEITPGMYAVADFAIDKKQNVLTVPVQAVKLGKEPTVYLINKKQEVEKRSVKTGIETADKVEIESGINADDFVVVGNTNELKPGTHVTPVLSNVAKTAEAHEKNNG